MSSTVLVIQDDMGEVTVYGPYKYGYLAQQDLDRMRVKDPEVMAWVVDMISPPGDDDS